VSGDWTELNKAVSHALRHEPWLYKLELDDEGR
jgi:putative RNA 2'-phosphotransferase